MGAMRRGAEYWNQTQRLSEPFVEPWGADPLAFFRGVLGFPLKESIGVFYKGDLGFGSGLSEFRV